jgi:hypothetical protein
MEKKNSIGEALNRAQVVLLENVQKLEEAVGPESGETLEEVCTRLRATQTQVTRHFRLEEKNGFLTDVAEREPRLDRAVEHLVAEHRELAQSLDTLVRKARATSVLDNALREAIRGWIARLRDHEARETDLIQDAFTVDLGAED